MVRNRKTVLPKGHIRKYTSSGTSQVSQEKRIEQNKALIEAGKRQAEQAAAAAIAAAQDDAAAERAKTAAVESHWQAFNDSNLRDAVERKEAAEQQAAINTAAYDELYSTARKSLLKAGHILNVTTVEGAKLIRDAGKAAGSVLASNLLDSEASLKDLSAAMDLQRLYGESEYLAKLASKTAPLARGINKIRCLDAKLRAQRR